MKKKYIFCICLLITMLIVIYDDSHASNKVTIVTIGGGGEMVHVGINRNPQKMVDRILGYWKEELNKGVA